MVCYEFLKSCALNYRIMCYESSISQNRVLSVSRTVKWGALSLWNGMLPISEIMCFEFIESCAMKETFPKTSCLQGHIILSFLAWPSLAPLIEHSLSTR